MSRTKKPRTILAEGVPVADAAVVAETPDDAGAGDGAEEQDDDEAEEPDDDESDDEPEEESEEEPEEPAEEQPKRARKTAGKAAGKPAQIEAPRPARKPRRVFESSPLECAVRRILPGGTSETCQWFDEMTQRRLDRFPLAFVGGPEGDRIRERWGGGTYVLKLWRGNRVQGGTRRITFEGPSKPAYPNAPGLAVVAPVAIAPAPAAPAPLPQSPADLAYQRGMDNGLGFARLTRDWFGELLSRERAEQDARLKRLEIESRERLERERQDSHQFMQRALALAPTAPAAPQTDPGLLETLDDIRGALTERGEAAAADGLLRLAGELGKPLLEAIKPLGEGWAAERAARAELELKIKEQDLRKAQAAADAAEAEARAKAAAATNGGSGTPAERKTQS